MNLSRLEIGSYSNNQRTQASQMQKYRMRNWINPSGNQKSATRERKKKQPT
jgi:hypothetical protein